MRSLILLFALALAASADEIHLKSGGKLVGTIVEDGDPVVLKTPGGGTIRIAREKIDRIEKKPLPADLVKAPADPKKKVASPSPVHVDILNAFSVRPPPGWRKIASSKNSKCTFGAPAESGPFKMDVWILRSPGAELEPVFRTVVKSYKEAFPGYEAKWEKTTTLGKMPAWQFAGEFVNKEGGQKLAHVHTLGGANGLYYMVFFTGEPEKFEAILGDVRGCLDSFEELPPLGLSKDEEKNFIEAYSRGVELFQGGKDAEAIVEFEKASAIVPKHAETHKNLGILFAKVKNLKRAIEEYTTVANLRPDDAVALFDLGTLLFQNNRYPDALAKFEKAVEIQPDYSEAWVNVGAVYAQMGEHQKAVDSFKTAVEIEPKSTGALFNLGQVEYLRNRYKEAREAWERVLVIDKEHAGALDGLKKLKQEGH